MAVDHFEEHFHPIDGVDWNFNILFDDQPQVAQMAKEYGAALQHPGLYEPIPAQWLHATILRVGLVDDYFEDEMLTVAKQLESKLLNLKLPRFVLGPWWMWGGNPVVHITPESPLTKLFDLVISELEAVVGRERMPKPSRFIPHVTLAYSRTYEEEREVHRQLLELPIKPVEFQATHLSLLKQKPVDSHYTWEIVKNLSIG